MKTMKFHMMELLSNALVISRSNKNTTFFGCFIKDDILHSFVLAKSTLNDRPINTCSFKPDPLPLNDTVRSSHMKLLLRKYDK